MQGRVLSRQSLKDPALRRFATAIGDGVCAVQGRVLSRQSLQDPALRRFTTAMNVRVCCDFLRGRHLRLWEKIVRRLAASVRACACVYSGRVQGGIAQGGLCRVRGELN